MKMPFVLIVSAGLLSGVAAAFAQHRHGDHSQMAHDAASGSLGGYASLQSRTIKALSEQQIADLRAGKGMSLALPAELNGYPGPSHALELAGPLKLSEAQKSRIQAVFNRMHQEARTGGEAVIAAEMTLDRLFKEGKASVESLRKATRAAAQAQGDLREVHLRAHLDMMGVLTTEQVSDYQRLRGYTK